MSYVVIIYPDLDDLWYSPLTTTWRPIDGGTTYWTNYARFTLTII